MADEHPRRLALVIVVQAEYEHWEPLTEVPKAARKLADALTAAGYDSYLPQLVRGGSKAEIETTLDEGLTRLKARDGLVLYWIGHGTGNGLHYLVTRESPKSGLSTAKALPSRDLGNLVANCPAEKILIIVDTCYSSSGAQGIADEILTILNQRTVSAGQLRCVAVIPSASALRQAQEGALCRALLSLLTDPNPQGRTWRDQDEFIAVGDLSDALVAAVMTSMGPDWQPPQPIITGVGQRFLPNPRYRGLQPVLDVETRRRLLEIPEALQLAARGIEAGKAGFYFTGRIRVLTELATWVREGTGMVVLTGPPGSGKSAVVGRVITLSHRTATVTEAGLLDGVPQQTLPPEGSVDAAVHAKGLTAADCAKAIARQVGMDLPSEVSFDVDGFLEQAKRVGRLLTMVVDALDESADPQATGTLLRRLVTEAGARVLAGTRRSPDGRVIPEGEDRHSRLRALFGEEARVIDLEDEPDTEADITSYVTARLRDDPRSHHRSDLEGVAEAARAVAHKAAGVFLYARVVCRTLQEAETLDVSSLPGGPLEALSADLEVRFAGHRELVEALLAALAWGQGGGLSRRVWATVASAISPTGRPYTDSDVVWLLDNAGFHVLEAGEAGQTVYRLAHQSFADHYREGIDAPAAHRRIAEALAHGITGPSWFDADPYLLRHLAVHAVTGGILDRLVGDVCFLAAANPAQLLRGFRGLTNPEAERIAGLYRRAADRISLADPVERMALLHLTACQEAEDLAPRMEPLLPPGWRCRWARWQQTAPYTIFGRLGGPLASVALGEIEGEPVVVSGGRDGIVRLWDARAGQQRGEPLRGHEGVVSSVALGEVDGEPVVVSGGGDGGVRLWDARTGQQRGGPLRGHEGAVTTLALGELDGRPVAVSGSEDRTVRLWDLTAHRSLGEALVGHTDVVAAVAMGEIDGRPVAVSGSGDETIIVWDLMARRKFTGPLRGNPPGAFAAIAMAEVDGRPVAISGSWNRAVVVWDLRSGTPLDKPLYGHGGGIAAVAMWELDGRPVAISGSWDGTVQFWDLQTAAPVGQPHYVYAGGVTAFALGHIEGQPVAICCSEDGTLRIGELRADISHPATSAGRGRHTAVALRELGGGPVMVSGSDLGNVQIWDSQRNRARTIEAGSAVFAVDVGQVNGRLVAVAGGWDQTVRLWDLHAGTALGEPLRGHAAWVSAVALGNVEGRPVAISGSGDATVRAWDLRAGTALGEPLRGHAGTISAVAVGELEGRPVAISGSWDGTLRVWDLRAGTALGEALRGHAEEVSAVAVGELEGRPVAISGSWDGTVRVWDLRARTALGEPLRGHAGTVSAVAVGKLEGQPVAISGSGDETVRVWELPLGNVRTIEVGSPVWAVSFAAPNRSAIATTLGLVVLDLQPLGPRRG